MAQTNDEIIKRIMERYVETPIHSVNLHTRLNWIINQARLATLDELKTLLDLHKRVLSETEDYNKRRGIAIALAELDTLRGIAIALSELEALRKKVMP